MNIEVFCADALSNRAKVLVVGDVMLDSYYLGSVSRISPEAPVPVFKQQGERSVLGGAANVAANLVAAKQSVGILAIVGRDTASRDIKSIMSEMGIDVSLLRETDRPTTVKTRFLADNNQQVMRLDVEDSSPVDATVLESMLQEFCEIIGLYDAVLISDYMKGLLQPGFTKAIIEAANHSGVPVFVDVKDPNYEKYQDAFVIKPNLTELKTLTGMPVGSKEEISLASKELRRKSNAKYVLTTCGSQGMMLVGEDGLVTSIPAFCKEVFDVTGAGDTAIAYLVASYANGIGIAEAVGIANIASGLQVSKVGTSLVGLDEVVCAIEGLRASKNVRDRRIAMREAALLRSRNIGKKIVFTNGCFDILHIGHIEYLRQAAALGDVLVVGINSDDSVRKIKGPKRPINPVADRAAMLSSYDFIDYVVVFEEETPYQVIEAIQPDVLVKGGDYMAEDIVGADIVKARGGEVLVLPFVDGKSSTSVIERILELYK